MPGVYLVVAIQIWWAIATQFNPYPDEVTLLKELPSSL